MGKKSTPYRTGPKDAAIEKMMIEVDRVFDMLLGTLGCTDGRDAVLISHWQENGFRIQVTRKRDGRALTRFVNAAGAISR